MGGTPGSPHDDPALEPDQFCADVRHLGLGGGALHEPQNVREDLVGVLAVGADAGEPHLGQLPEVPFSHFRRRDLELLANSPQKSAHDLPLGLERTGIRKVKG
jgi:hypothetical protein